jgi:hypothetical protein
MGLGLLDYNVFRDDRDTMLNSRGGGVLLAVRNNFDCFLINVDNVPGIQHIFLLLKYNKMNILLSCMYIPPSSPKDIYIYIYIYMKHCKIVENIIHNYSILNVLIIGDFNLSGFPWSDYSLYNDPVANVFIQSYLFYLGLKQINNVSNFRNDILNLVLTNTNIDIIRAGCSLTPLIDSYHSPLDFIYFILVSKVVPESFCPIIHNVNNTNFNDLIKFLSNIDLNYNILNLEKSILKFYDILNHSIDIFVPKVKLNLQHRLP